MKRSRPAWRQRFEVHTSRGVPRIRTLGMAKAPKVRFDKDSELVSVLVLLAVITLLLAALAWASRNSPPERLADAVLSGHRLNPGCANVVVASDVSGTMSKIASVRNRALQQIVAFSKSNLRSDDVLTVVTYDSKVAVAMPPTRVKDLSDAPVPEPVPGGDSTLLLPVIKALRTDLGGTGCSTTGLASVTDALLADAPGELAQALHDAGLARVRLLVPGGHGRPGPTSDHALDAVGVEHFKANSPDSLGLAFGALLSDLTGQHLTHR